MSLRDLTIVRKMGLILMFNTLIAVLAISLVFFVGTAINVYHDNQEQLLALAEVVGENSRAALAFNDPDSARNTLAALHVKRDMTAARLIDPQGVVFASADFSEQHEHFDKLRQRLVDAVFPVSLTVSHIIVDDKKNIGRIELEVHLHHVWSDLLNSLVLMALIAIGLAVLAAYFALRLRRIVTDPILELARVSHQVSREGGYSIRAAKLGNDEIGALVDDFNHMLTEIQARDEALELERDSLEQRVAQRTAELLVARDAAEAASRAKSEFLASMSHELRTPLNSILGFSQLLGMDPDLSEDTRDQAQEIEHAGLHLLSLINDLIDLARIESGKMELSLEAVPVMPILKDSLAMVAPIASKLGIELTEAHCHCNVDIGQVSVQADYNRLRQVLINLLSNAIKYNRPQGSVRLSCSMDDSNVRISVVDTGPGIPAAKQSRIFNAFDRLGAERGTIEGTGIGLVITRRIVEAMDGSIGFESAEGKGSTFWVEFPFAAPADLPATLETAAAADTGTGLLQTSRPVVLYVEDNPMNLRLMQQLFVMRKDLELRTATTAELGLDLARAEPPALILMDINLPGMDGYQALALLKADSRTARIPVIAVSANAMKGDESRGLEAGFDDYVTKPVDIGKLMAILTQFLGE